MVESYIKMVTKTKRIRTAYASHTRGTATIFITKANGRVGPRRYAGTQVDRRLWCILIFIRLSRFTIYSMYDVRLITKTVFLGETLCPSYVSYVSKILRCTIDCHNS